MAELQKCPFCGGEAKILVNLSGMYTICCSNDKCNISVSTKPTPVKKEDVIEAWNNRATEAEIRAKAQREIVEWCFDNKVDFAILERYANKEGVVDCVLKHFMADQLKEE